ncbi:MAG: OsmC family protein [Candidatus Nitrospinota bacterium M3_3B_026]
MTEKKKENIMGGTLEWKGGLALSGAADGGGRLEFDGARAGLKPTEALLLGLAGCMSMDVVSILEKKRVKLESYSARIEGEKSDTFPKYFKRAELTLTAKGEGLDEAKFSRAVELSKEKYCSVLHSLRQDFTLEVRTVIEG